MSSSNPLCSTCEKEKGSVRCEGCAKLFCFKHLADHRQELDKEFEQIETNYNLLYESMNQRSEGPSQHVMIERINQWEQNSIMKIKLEAERARNLVVESTTGDLTTFKSKWQVLTDELRQNRASNNFVENDLNEWRQKLKNMKEELLNPEKIQIRDDFSPLVLKLCVDFLDFSDRFHQSSGNTIFQDDFKVVVKDKPDVHTDVRGKQEYQTAQRTLKFKIEQLPDNGWILFGITSKETALKSESFSSTTVYGWSTRNQVYKAGQLLLTTLNETLQNDIIQLTIDCDQRLIRFLNERTNRCLEMSVDPLCCPFPWQIHLNLYHASTKVRIL